MNYFKSKITKKLIGEASKLNFGTGMSKRDNMLFYMVYQSINNFLSKVVGKGMVKFKLDDKKLMSRIYFGINQVIPVFIERDDFHPDVDTAEFGFSTKGLHIHEDGDIFLFIIVNKSTLDVFFLGCLNTNEIYNRGDFDIYRGVVYIKSAHVKDLKKYFI